MIIASVFGVLLDRDIQGSEEKEEAVFFFQGVNFRGGEL